MGGFSRHDTSVTDGRRITSRNSVLNADALPTFDNKIGDVYYVLETQGTILSLPPTLKRSGEYRWTGVEWKRFGKIPSEVITEKEHGAPAHDPLIPYYAGNLVYVDGAVFRCVADIPPKTFDANDWEAVVLNTSISDADGDTKIEVEQAADEDIIRFTTAGTERLKLDGSRIIPTNSNFSVFIGENAGTDTVSTSNNNVFIGRNVGSSITTGNGNVALGTNALLNNDVGINNTSIGISSLQSNQNGTGLVAAGVRALKSNTSGIQNVALGKDALGGNTTGAYNIGIGPDAGRYIADGSTPKETGGNSIYIGKGTKAKVNGTTNEIVIGTDVFGKGNNTITLGNGASTELYTAADIISKRFHTIWKSSVNIYNTDDIVIYNGALYKNLTGSNTAVAPDSDTTNWKNLAPQQTYEYLIGRPSVTSFSASVGTIFPYNGVVDSSGSSITSSFDGKFTLAANGFYKLTANAGPVAGDGYSAWRFYDDVVNAEIQTSSVGIGWGNNYTASYSDDPNITAIIETGASPMTVYLRKVNGQNSVPHRIDQVYARARIFIEKMK